MGKRDRERKDRILSGLEYPHTVSLAEGPIRAIGMSGGLLDPPWDGMVADTKAVVLESAFDHIRAMGFFPKVEQDDAAMVRVGMYCRHGNADAGVTLSLSEEGRWHVAFQTFVGPPLVSDCPCDAWYPGGRP